MADKNKFSVTTTGGLPIALLLLTINTIAVVAGITTKSLPTVLNGNNTDTDQLVQIRSLLQQPTRAFLIQHKTSLSPIQQTQILDDVQKNQKIQLPSSTLLAAEDRQRSLFGNGGIHHISFPFEPTNVYRPDNSHVVSGNLSPPAPPVSGIIFPSQQAPTQQQQQQQQFNYISAFRPSPNVDHLYNQQQSHLVYDPFNKQTYRESPNQSFSDNGAAPKIQFVPSTIATVPAAGIFQQQPSSSDKPNFDQLFNLYKYTTTPSPINYILSSESQTQPPYKPIAPNYLNKIQSESSFANHVTAKPTYGKELSKNNNYATPISNKQIASETNNNDDSDHRNKIVKEIYLKTNPEILIANDRQKFFQQLLEDGKTSSDFLDSGIGKNDQNTAQSDSNSIKAQFEKELLRQLQVESAAAIPKLNIPPSALSLLPTNFSGISEISLPNGQRIQVSKDYNQLAAAEDNAPGSGTADIRTILVKQPSTVTSTTGKPSERILAELTKGVLPPGADFELIRHNKDGGLEEIGNLPQNLPQKKVTFVILEEQPDGSVKVQGVRGSEKESLKESGEEVDSIIKKIKEGQLKLPPSANNNNKATNNNNNNINDKSKKTYYQQGTINKQIDSKSTSTQKSSDFQTSFDYRIKNANKKKIPSNDDQQTNEILKAFKQQTESGNKAIFLPTPSVVNQQPSPPQTSSLSKPNNYHSVVSSSLQPTTVTYPFVSSSPPPNNNLYVQDDRLLLSGNYFVQNTLSPLAENSVRDDFPTSYVPTPQQQSDKFAWDNNYYQPDHSTTASSAIFSSSSSSTPKNSHDNEDNAVYFYNNSGYFSSLLPTNHIPDPAVMNNQLTPLLSTNQNFPPHHSVFFSTTPAQEKTSASSTIPPLQYTNIARTQTSTEVSPTQVAVGSTTASENNYNRISPSRKQHKNQSEKPTLSYEQQQQQTEQTDNEEHESQIDEFPKQQNNGTLSDLLKKEGFYAMAKFLKQSGLDSILNDTGPFTLFIPTDKAFRTLLIQLGGPDKAEEKFKDNPRLLSGLLLHHVIPGAFRVGNLQDEMTGVSLAGTQLRVNTYTTHDIEWNDVKIVTVNGARILDEKDVVIPQGIAHAVDRVMFPLPVGNLLQSLQADRENRYSNFIHILEQSGLQPLLTGSRTFTVFAPLNRSFAGSDYTKLSSNQKDAKAFILKHIVPGALYSAGMKYYQVRESMDDSQQITIYKEAGRIKVNSAHVVTRNVPATNGVIHAIDATL